MRSSRWYGPVAAALVLSYMGPASAQTDVYRIGDRRPAFERSAVPTIQAMAPDPLENKPKQCSRDSSGELLLCTQGADALKGLHWGMGLLYSSSNFGGVTDVTLVKNGSDTVVKVTKTSGSAARAAFELHYFIPAPKFSTIQWAWGPFVSLNSKPLTDLAASSLSSVGGGLMIGANAYVDDSGGKSVSHSVNLGLGWMVDTGVKELAPGVVNGQVTTLGQDELLRTTTRSGFMAILSYNFFLN